MGVHTPDLNIGVSLGIWLCKLLRVSMLCSGVGTTRWKIVQAAGRLGRKPSDAAIFITVVERKNALRGVMCAG